MFCEGAWGLHLHNASQNIMVRWCNFHDLSGGGIAVGDVMMTRNVTDPTQQMANITVEVRRHYDIFCYSPAKMLKELIFPYYCQYAVILHN